MPEPGKKRRKPNGKAGPAGGVSARRDPNGSQWSLVHPRAARDRAEDLEEVRLMIEAGELEIAADELRWLLSGCAQFIEAHALAGEIALELSNDVPLARGHFGYAYQLGLRALQRAGVEGPLPASHPANLGWHQAARGLAFCLETLGERRMADEVAGAVQAADPADPAGVMALLAELRSPAPGPDEPELFQLQWKPTRPATPPPAEG